MVKTLPQTAFVNSNSPRSDERIGRVVCLTMAEALAAWASGMYKEKRKLVSAYAIKSDLAPGPIAKLRKS